MVPALVATSSSGSTISARCASARRGRIGRNELKQGRGPRVAQFGIERGAEAESVEPISATHEPRQRIFPIYKKEARSFAAVPGGREAE